MQRFDFINLDVNGIRLVVVGCRSSWSWNYWNWSRIFIVDLLCRNKYRYNII
jgi:hypothetical protein